MIYEIDMCGNCFLVHVQTNVCGTLFSVKVVQEHFTTLPQHQVLSCRAKVVEFVLVVVGSGYPKAAVMTVKDELLGWLKGCQRSSVELLPNSWAVAELNSASTCTC